ncbi:MAG: outer membrane beta-barrel protein [Betaproteobacteria bacterium]
MNKANQARRMCLMAVATAAATASPFAGAQESHWYGGVNLGQSRSTIDDKRISSGLLGAGFTVTGIKDDDRDTAGKIFAGYQFSRYFAVEGGYFNLGKFGFTANTLPAGSLNGRIKLQGMNLDLVGRVPISERFSAFARVGANYAQARDTFTGTGSVFVRTSHASANDTNIKYGGGLEFAFNEALSLRLEAERYRINDAVGNRGDVDLASVGLVYRFGKPRLAPVMISRAPEPVREAITPPPATTVTIIEPAKPVAPPPPPPPRFEKIVLSATELFGFDSAVLQLPQPKLDDIARALNAHREIGRVGITGYTDRIGSRTYNQKLSERRANAVRTYLIGKSVDGNRLVASGRSEENPLVQCREKSRPALIICLAPNRRVEVEQIVFEQRVQ